MTPREALDRIAALEVHDPDDRGSDTCDADEVRAILAEVTPETGCTLDRDALLDLLRDALGQHRLDGSVAVGALADRVLALVRPAAIDRDALMEAFRFMPEEYRASATDWVLALVRPVAGVTLTPEEAAMVVQLYRIIRLGVGSSSILPGTSALVARLEATR